MPRPVTGGRGQHHGAVIQRQRSDFLDPEGQAADIMPGLEEELNDALKRIAEEEGYAQ